MRSNMLLFWKPRREALLFPRGVDSCCPDGRRGGGGGGSERRRGGGRRQGHGNLQEDSRGAAAAERTPNLSLPAQPQFSFLFLQKILPFFILFIFFSPPTPHPSSSRSPVSVGLGPVKQRHGSGERRHRQRRDVEETSRRHQEDFWF